MRWCSMDAGMPLEKRQLTEKAAKGAKNKVGSRGRVAVKDKPRNMEAPQARRQVKWHSLIYDPEASERGQRRGGKAKRAQRTRRTAGGGKREWGSEGTVKKSERRLGRNSAAERGWRKPWAEGV